MHHEKTTQQAFTREVLPAERVFLRAPAANLTLVAKVKGCIKKEVFEAALNKVRKTHPLLNTRVQITQDQKAVFTSANVPEFTVKICPRTSETQWFQESLEQHHIPFNVEKGPLIRFILLQSNEISEIIIFCQHLICDGLSLSFLMKDLLLHLGDPNRKPRIALEPPLLAPSNFPVATSPSLLVRLIMKKINNSWEKHKQLFNYEDFKAIHRAYWENFSYRVLIIEMTPEETSDLIIRCRQNTGTVTAALCTAFLAARMEVLKDGNNKPTVYVPVNLRSRLQKPAGESFGLYASGVKIRFKFNPRKSYWDNAREFNKQLRSNVNYDKVFKNIVNMNLIDSTLWDAQSFSFLGKMVPVDSNRYQKLSAFSKDEKNPVVKLNKGIREKAPQLSVTNLGRLDFPVKYGAFELDKMFFAPSTGPFLEIVLGVLTVNGKLAITVNYIEEKIKTETVNAIKDRAVKYLKLQK